MEIMYPQQKHKERHTVNKATRERNRVLGQTAGSPHVLGSMPAVVQGMAKPIMKCIYQNDIGKFQKMNIFR